MAKCDRLWGSRTRPKHANPVEKGILGLVIDPFLASCQVYCLGFEEELTVPLKYLSLFITP